MVVQRVHFAVKRHLAYKKQLEFNWRQTWGLCFLFKFFQKTVFLNVINLCDVQISEKNVTVDLFQYGF